MWVRVWWLQKLVSINRMTDTEEGNHQTRTHMIAWRLGRAPWDAKMIKLADIIDNCRNVSIHDSEVAAAYKAEKRQVLVEMLRCEGSRLEKHPLFQAACLLTGAKGRRPSLRKGLSLPLSTPEHRKGQFERLLKRVFPSGQGCASGNSVRALAR